MIGFGQASLNAGAHCDTVISIFSVTNKQTNKQTNIQKNNKLIRKDKVERAQVHPSAKQLSSGCMLLEPDISPFFASQAYLSSLSRKWGCISYAFKPLDGVVHAHKPHFSVMVFRKNVFVFSMIK